MIFRLRRGLVLLFYSSSYLFEVQNDQIVTKNDAFKCKKNGREGSFSMDDFYKTRTNESIDQIGKKHIEVCIAQNYGSTNEKLGFFCGVNYFAPYVPLLTLELFLINILPFHYSRQWGNVIYFSKSVNLSLSHFLYQCFTYILLLSFHWIIIL